MFAFEIAEVDVRVFMNKLLRENTFDKFEVRGIEIISFTKFEISGALDKDFLSEDLNDTDRKYCTWSELKPHVFNIIKGSKRPKAMKFIFSLPKHAVEALHKNAAAYFLNLTFDGNLIFGITATSEKNFSMDKTIDIAWEDYIRNFLEDNQIVISTHTY